MKTLETLYQEVLASDELKKGLAGAAKTPEGLTEWVKAQGCEATEAEVVDFIKSLRKGEGELADDELSAVAGGCNSTEAIYSMTVAFCIGFAIMSAVDPVSENKDDWGDKLLCDI